jgi:hypothetical protein
MLHRAESSDLEGMWKLSTVAKFKAFAWGHRVVTNASFMVTGPTYRTHSYEAGMLTTVSLLVQTATSRDSDAFWRAVQAAYKPH